MVALIAIAAMMALTAVRPGPFGGCADCQEEHLAPQRDEMLGWMTNGTGESVSAVQSHVYKTAPYRVSEERFERDEDSYELRLFVYMPPGWTDADRRSAVVLFHGGGWQIGNPVAIKDLGMYLASQGLVVVMPEYRLRMGAHICIEDARSAMRWTKANAARLGVDPERIGAGGRSAGGHIALACATDQKIDAKSDDLDIDPMPAFLVCQVPALTPYAKTTDVSVTGTEEIKAMCTPYAWSRTPHPPALFLCGARDWRATEGFRYVVSAMLKDGMKEEVQVWIGDDAGHDLAKVYDLQSKRRIHLFLAALGYMEQSFKLEVPADLHPLWRLHIGVDAGKLHKPVSARTGRGDDASCLIDGSGLSIDERNGFSMHDKEPDTGWMMRKNEENPQVVLDLGAPKDIAALWLWTHRRAGDLRTVEILGAGEDGVYAVLEAAAWIYDVHEESHAQRIPLDGAAVRYVKLRPLCRKLPKSEETYFPPNWNLDELRVELK